MGSVVDDGPTHSRVWIEQWTDWRDELRYTVDCFMTAILSWSSANAPAPVTPKEVGFHYDRPANIDAHQAAFPSAVLKFETDVSYQIYDNACLDQPVLGANSDLFREFEDKVRRVIARVGNSDTWTEKVRHRVVKGLKGSSPTLEEIASELAVSMRTLQLRLSEEGTSYSEILSFARADLAKEFLKHGDVRNDEIAYLLGYSEESVFSRSFKKWTGRTPTEFRAAPA